MKWLSLLVCLAACRPAASVALPTVATPPVATASATVSMPQVPVAKVVVTGAPYAHLALWRVASTGWIAPVEFPWAELTIVDSLVVSPDSREVAYVEGGSKFGPLLVRALDDGSKTVVAPHTAGGELLVVAWSPDGHELLYAARSAQHVTPSNHWNAPPAGPSSYFVFDRKEQRSAPIDVPGEFAAWLPSGEVVVVDDDGALTRASNGTKTPLVARSRHSDFTLDAARARLLSIGWDESKHVNEVLALDLRTWTEEAISPPAPYSTYLWPAASPSGAHVAWIASSRPHPRVLAESLVVDGKTVVAPTRDLVGFVWIDEHGLVAHYRNRIDVIDARDGTVKGTKPTDADDMMQ